MMREQKIRLLENVEKMAREMIATTGSCGRPYNWMGWVMIESNIKRYKDNYKEA